MVHALYFEKSKKSFNKSVSILVPQDATTRWPRAALRVASETVSI